MLSKKMLWVILFFYGCLFALENELDEKWKKANNFFKQAKTRQEYEEAVGYYKEIVDTGVENGYLFYNLGNAYLKAEKIDYALLFYRRAEKYIGNDPYLIENLKFAQSIINKKIQFQNSSKKSTTEYLFFWHHWKYKTRLAIFIFVYVCFWLLLMIKLTKWKLPFWNLLFIVIFLLAVIGGSVGYDVIYNKNNNAILVGETVEIRKGDSPTYEFLYGEKEIIGGVEVEILEQRSDWTKVKLPDGLYGWVKNNSVKKI